MNRVARGAWICWVVLGCCGLSCAQEQTPLPDALADLPPQSGLPDPLVMRGGARVSSPEQWAQRRAEILDLLLHYQYGVMPPAPKNIGVEDYVAREGFGGLAMVHTFTLVMGPPPGFRMQAGLILPKIGKPPFPAIVAIDPVWHDHVAPTARMLVERGYAFSGFVYFDLDRDAPDREQGVYPFYPEYDWRTIAAWAWGAMRVVDYLRTRADINPACLAVTGHSRTGKAALLAGALDERIALTAPHCSGAGGAGSYRMQPKGAETLADITRGDRFHYWFHPRLALFAGHEDRLPFDQHFLKAAIAPRALLSLEANADLWANPAGTRFTHQAAEPVFGFLGVADHIALHFREGGHDMTPEDWETLLSFADSLFRGASRPVAR